MIKQAIKKKFLNADGTINGTVVASFITLLILLAQEVLAIFNIKFTGDWSQIAGAVNTVLAILSAAGFVEGQGKIGVQGLQAPQAPVQPTQQPVSVQAPGVTLQDMIDNPIPGTTIKQTAPASATPVAPKTSAKAKGGAPKGIPTPPKAGDSNGTK